ncbi:MAG: epoxyqueuosine reductase QueH [Christensenella sp.]|uniref:epoxyqueuosine reductase QueH n=1 Tax=Christensenella sp. TaxID=1935934 RepID=UPI002B1F3230|nr:epoxyqueuosine reductase QueH [Christensenella sp.]MEA5002151.1 epoxyqueuosine reductase QueH [Christensenella sp.]
MKILLHMCCAPCSVACVKSLREEGLDITGFWYNPNIHPYMEYKSRKNTAVEYAKTIGLPLVMRDEYGLRQFVAQVSPEFEKRCGYCYQTRMDEAAKYAAENGFDAFLTTLLISPYQNHEMICESAQSAAQKYDTQFLYRDFRPLFREGQDAARERGLYMQKYCGCIFSEEERYQKKPKK